MDSFVVILIVFGVLAVIVLATSLKIVRQANAVVVERLGKFYKTLDVGIHFIIPFF